MNKLRMFLAVLVLSLSALRGYCAGLNTGSVPVSVNEGTPIKIDEIDRSAVFVLSGSPSLQPLPISFGFVSVEDSRFLSCYSKNGQNLWLTHIGKITSISKNDSDFIFAVTQNGEVAAINPSGVILWQKYLDFIPEKILPSKEGRIFVSSKSNLACLSICGLLKWNVKTEKQGKLSPALMNDQSILVFLEKTVNSKSCAVRYSMYGEVLEEIVFQGNVINWFSVSDGIILVFADGTTGMISTKIDDDGKNLSISAWKNSQTHCGSNTKFVEMDSSHAALITPGKNIETIDFKNGTMNYSIPIKEIKNEIISVNYIDSMFIIMDSSICAVYRENDKKLFKSYLYPRKDGKYSWNYALFIDYGYLEFLSDDWTISVFKIVSTSKEKELLNTYDSLYKVRLYLDKDSFSNGSNEIYKKDYQSIMDMINFGEYGSKEIDVTKLCLSAINQHVEKNNTVNLYNSNEINFNYNYTLADFEEIFKLTSVLHNSTIRDAFIDIINSENDSFMLSRALEAAAAYPFDPDGRMLDAVQALIRRTNKNDIQILKSAANLAYEISRFMGKPAFYTYGKMILGELFYPQYDTKIKQFARTLLQKLADSK